MMASLPLKTLLWILLALFVPTMAGLATIDAGLKVPAAGGIIAFEFCGFSASCELVLQQWGVPGQRLALLSLGLDYLYLLIYPALICVGLLLAAPGVSGRLKAMTVTMAWLAPVAGLADAVENYCLIQVVLTGSGTAYGLPAAIFATIKFAVLAASLTCLLVVLVLRLVRGARH